MAALFIGEETMINWEALSEFLKILLQFANVVVLGYALFKFLNKPHSTLETRVNEHEVKIKEIEDSLKQGNDRFRKQEDTNEVLIRSVFALLEFEVHYCETEQKPITKNLERAKDDLHDYLAQK